MSKILISLSAAAPKAKGDRVIVKIGKDQWYAGEITTVSRDKTLVNVLFNDGEKEKVKYVAAKLIGVKGKKTAYTDAEAKVLIDKYKEKITGKPVTVKPVRPTTPPKTSGKDKARIILPGSEITEFVKGTPHFAPDSKPGLTQEAIDLIESVKREGVPSFMTSNLKRIARENGLLVTGTDTPDSIIANLRIKRQMRK